MRSSNRAIRVISLTPAAGRDILGSSTSTTRYSYNFRIAVDYVARNGFLDWSPATPRVTEVPARQTRNATPWSIITPIVPSTGPTVSRTIVTIIAIITGIVAIVTVVT